MSKLVTIYGGSGFLGRYIARRMAKEGWRVRVAVRRPNEAMFVKPYGVVGQVEPVLCNIRDDASVAAVMQGADAVVNCVAVMNNLGKNRMDAVNVDGADRVARIAAQQGIGQLVHISAIGANSDGPSEYLRSKGDGEAAVLSHVPGAMILRPSILFGPEDAFFNRFASMARMTPVLPIAGASTMFQPVYADDVAAAAVEGVTGRAEGGIYELGGPEADSFRGLMQRMLDVIRRRRLVLNMPRLMAKGVAFGFDMAQAMTGGLFTNTMLTRDQLKSLSVDNTVGTEAQGFEALGITPVTMETILPDYLWRFRHSGQYSDIKNSARKLKT